MPTYPGFFPYEGVFKKQSFPVKASTVLAIGDTLVYDNAGTNQDVTAGATNGLFIAVYGDTDIAATDSDYATAHKQKMCWRVSRDPAQLWLANVEAGTNAAATIEGVNVDLNSADGLNVGSTSNGDFRVTHVVDANTAIGYFTE